MTITATPNNNSNNNNNDNTKDNNDDNIDDDIRVILKAPFHRMTDI